jgi:Protein of unknown function (DUF1587)
VSTEDRSLDQGCTSWIRPEPLAGGHPSFAFVMQMRNFVVFAGFALSCTGSIVGGVSQTGAGGGGTATHQTLDCSAATAAQLKAPLRRLTSREYLNSVTDAFPRVSWPTITFPPATVVEGFDTNVDTVLWRRALSTDERQRRREAHRRRPRSA